MIMYVLKPLKLSKTGPTKLSTDDLKKSKIFKILVERNFKSGDYLEFLSHETEFFANVRFEPSFGTV